jgi:signal transduction histidine kinase
LALMLWWRQRDPLYGWFALAAFLGVVRNVDRVWPDVPVSWPLWGAIVAVCYASHLALICRFTLMALGPVSREMNRAIDVVLVLSSTLAILSFALGRPLFWTLGLAALVPLGVISLTFVVREAMRTRSMTACVLAAAGALAVAAGIYDLGLIRMTNSSGLRNAYTQHAMFVFVVIMAGLVAERYSRSVADYRALNADLSKLVEDREQQLRGAFDSLRVQQHEQSVSTERQRIMREIHDGIGSHLVGLLNMVTRPNADMVAVEEQVQHALDEMRMAVDSLQPVHDDLITVLATLRYRLQPRLQAAGVEVVWDVAELPALRHLSPNAVLQVQRILLEAFTNVLKHACATQVAVRTRWYEADRLVSLQIADNGVGLRREAGANGASAAAGPRQGRGIGNMRARATSIGAELKVEPAKGGGTCLTLDWRVDGESVEGLTAS